MRMRSRGSGIYNKVTARVMEFPTNDLSAGFHKVDLLLHDTTHVTINFTAEGKMNLSMYFGDEKQVRDMITSLMDGVLNKEVYKDL